MPSRVALFLAAACVQALFVAAPSAAQQPRNYPEFTYERVRVEMRDGVKLSADIYRPVTPARVKVPVILQLTPYHQLYAALGPPRDGSAGR